MNFNLNFVQNRCHLAKNRNIITGFLKQTLAENICAALWENKTVRKVHLNHQTVTDAYLQHFLNCSVLLYGCRLEVGIMLLLLSDFPNFESSMMNHIKSRILKSFLSTNKSNVESYWKWLLARRGDAIETLSTSLNS